MIQELTKEAKTILDLETDKRNSTYWLKQLGVAIEEEREIKEKRLTAEREKVRVLRDALTAVHRETLSGTRAKPSLQALKCIRERTEQVLAATEPGR